jgi:pilus assembly protein Flp/PilA
MLGNDMAHLIKLIQNTKGATAIEYGLIAALVSVAILAALNNFGDSTENMYNFIEKSIVDVS